MSPTMPPGGPAPGPNGLATQPLDTQQVNWASGKKLILYHTNWATYGRKFQVKDLPIQFISDINYAFFDIKRDDVTGAFIPVSSDPWADTDKRWTDPRESVPPLDPHEGAEPPVADGYSFSYAQQQQQQHQQQQQQQQQPYMQMPPHRPPKPYYGNFGQFRNLKSVPGIRFNLGLSIGGWTFSKHFSDAMATPASRSAFIGAILSILAAHPGLFNRIDLDWEHISPGGASYGEPGNSRRPDDGANFAAFLVALRAALDGMPDPPGTGGNGGNGGSVGRSITISACVTGDPDAMSALPLDTMSEILETINIMTYDHASSAWGPVPAGHHTNLYPTPYAPRSVHTTVDAYLARGVPPHKIVIGAAFYSRGFNDTSGLGHPSAGLVPDRSWEDGVCDYKSLPRPGAVEYWDDAAKASYSYDPARRVLNSYDTVQSVMEKCKYVWNRGLRGIIVWESSGDVPVSHERSLVAALFNGLARDPRRD
ncbi:glycoside hydrolase [Entophlyctis helioformis]|nr:glycoside hydrolase [Entophlyctis helioformis]